MNTTAFDIRDNLVSRIQSLIDNELVSIKSIGLNPYGFYGNDSEQPRFIINLSNVILFNNASAYGESSYIFDCMIISNIRNFDDDSEFDNKRKLMYGDAELVINELIEDGGEVVAGIEIDEDVYSEDFATAIKFTILRRS